MISTMTKKSTSEQIEVNWKKECKITIQILPRDNIQTILVYSDLYRKLKIKINKPLIIKWEIVKWEKNTLLHIEVIETELISKCRHQNKFLLCHLPSD